MESMAADDKSNQFSRYPARSRNQHHLDGGKDLKSQIPSTMTKADPEYSEMQNDGGAPSREDAASKDEDDGTERLSLHEVTLQHRQICEDLDKNLSKTDIPYEYLESKNELLSQWGTEGTFIHVMVDHIKTLLSDNGKSRNKSMDKYRSWSCVIPRIIPWLVFKHPNLIARRDDSHPTAFETAFEKCIDVAYCILGLLLDGKTQREMTMPCGRDSGNPCSVAFDHPLVLLVKSMSTSKDWCPHVDTSSILKYHWELKEIIERTMRHKKSDSRRTCLHYAIKEFISHPNSEAVDRLVRLSGREVINAKDSKDEQTPLLAAIAEFEKPRKEDVLALERLTEIIQLIVQECPEALYYKIPRGNIAYKELLLYDLQPQVKEWEKQMRMPVSNILKEAIIGDPRLHHDMKPMFLYPPGTTEHKIYLDLGDLKPIGSIFVDSVLQRIFGDANFETALSYIRLPPRNSPTTATTQDATDMLHSYQRIFEFLEARGVRKIFKVIVNDLTGRPHTDEMIMKLLKGFDVEDWDWKKLDMNSETIREAAPRVKSVSLHSSGHCWVLQCWVCETGLIRLDYLNKVEVTIHQGFRTAASRANYGRKFEEALRERFERQGRPLDIRVIVRDSVAEEENNPGHGGNQALAAQERASHRWIRHMDRFVLGLRNLPDDMEATVSKIKVKVALIGDGIDPVKMRFKVAEGRSFREYGYGSQDDYYLETGPYGTIMASLINKMCPMAELYVAKVVSNQFSTASPTAAARAIHWALEKEVDIISIIGTFSQHAESISEFKRAMVYAIDRRVLLFSCSTEDVKVVMPYLTSRTEVFKIGSTTDPDNMARSHSAVIRNVDFILPGREVLLQSGTETVEIHDCYVATALASGLAALILFCADLISKTDPQAIDQDGQKLRQPSNMRLVFENMSRDSYFAGYPEVQKYFKISGDDLTIPDIIKTLNSLEAGVCMPMF